MDMIGYSIGFATISPRFLPNGYECVRKNRERTKLNGNFTRTLLSCVLVNSQTNFFTHIDRNYTCLQDRRG